MVTLPRGRHGFSPIGRARAEDIAARKTAFAESLAQRTRPAVDPSAFTRDVQGHLLVPTAPEVGTRDGATLADDMLQRYAPPSVTPGRGSGAVTGHEEFQTLAARIDLSDAETRRRRTPVGIEPPDDDADDLVGGHGAWAGREDLALEDPTLGPRSTTMRSAGDDAGEEDRARPGMPLLRTPLVPVAGGALFSLARVDLERPLAQAPPLAGGRGQELSERLHGREEWQPTFLADHPLPVAVSPPPPTRIAGEDDEDGETDDGAEEIPVAQQPVRLDEAATAAPFTSLPELSGLIASVQRKAESGAEAEAPAVERRTLAMQQAAPSVGQPLDRATHTAMQTAFGGADLTNVRVHADEAAGDAAASLGAQAFTAGSSIYFARGAYQPGSADGLALVGHEIVHTLQQSEGVAVQRRIGAPSEDGLSDVEPADQEGQARDMEDALRRIADNLPSGTDLVTALGHIADSLPPGTDLTTALATTQPGNGAAAPLGATTTADTPSSVSAEQGSDLPAGRDENGAPDPSRDVSESLPAIDATPDSAGAITPAASAASTDDAATGAAPIVPAVAVRGVGQPDDMLVTPDGAPDGHGAAPDDSGPRGDRTLEARLSDASPAGPAGARDGGSAADSSGAPDPSAPSANGGSSFTAIRPGSPGLLDVGATTIGGGSAMLTSGIVSPNSLANLAARAGNVDNSVGGADDGSDGDDASDEAGDARSYTLASGINNAGYMSNGAASAGAPALSAPPTTQDPATSALRDADTLTVSGLATTDDPATDDPATSVSDSAEPLAPSVSGDNNTATARSAGDTSPAANVSSDSVIDDSTTEVSDGSADMSNGSAEVSDGSVGVSVGGEGTDAGVSAAGGADGVSARSDATGDDGVENGPDAGNATTGADGTGSDSARRVDDAVVSSPSTRRPRSMALTSMSPAVMLAGGAAVTAIGATAALAARNGSHGQAGAANGTGATPRAAGGAETQRGRQMAGAQAEADAQAQAEVDALFGGAPSMSDMLASDYLTPATPEEALRREVGARESAPLTGAAGRSLSPGLDQAVALSGELARRSGPAGENGAVSEEQDAAVGTGRPRADAVGGPSGRMSLLAPAALAAGGVAMAAGGAVTAHAAEADGAVEVDGDVGAPGRPGANAVGASMTQRTTPVFGALAGSADHPEHAALGETTADGAEAYAGPTGADGSGLNLLEDAANGQATTPAEQDTAARDGGPAPQSVEHAASPGAGETAQKAQPSIDDIVDRVMARLKRQLMLDHERSGGFLSDLLR